MELYLNNEIDKALFEAAFANARLRQEHNPSFFQRQGLIAIERAPFNIYFDVEKNKDGNFCFIAKVRVNYIFRFRNENRVDDGYWISAEDLLNQSQDEQTAHWKKIEAEGIW